MIGGGFSGVEVAGALADCLKGIARYYPGVAPAEVKVVLLQDQARLLPELPDALGLAAHGMLRRAGVEVRQGVSVAGVSAEGVVLADGTTIASAAVVATVGARPNALVTALGLPVERGRIRVGPGLNVEGRRDVWALGDCALVVQGPDGSISPPTAQFAVRQARLLARNLLAVLQGRGAEPFRYRPRGMMAAVGHLNGAAALPGLALRGLPAWLLWRGYYLSQMPTFGRKLRIAVEWTWGMLFPADITHIRFARSAEQETEPARLPERSRVA